MAAYRLRPARASDADAVATIWRTGWLDGHLGNVPEALVQARTPASFATRAQQRVPDTVVAELVDEDRQAVAGFTMVVDDELEQLYVDTEHRGRGVAGMLLRDAERRIAAAGHRRAWLAVVDGNAPARACYERNGWVDEGMFDYPAAISAGTTAVPCHRYAKRL
jgi:ribosomal protein S18 acetylase RimI-like enzyme